ncbi:FAD-dependent monooxygenase [uncultured Sphingomonas sp.]|uniref:NAD(P)/FAD-dependent oxidoreductase n=1 Tax=uncultured Sphingomonas sp. TaxID=158754 RepID=UPI002637ACFF|nr:FAD-dependent monooxygenase [uncultured Sphingomonas sp.]
MRRTSALIVGGGPAGAAAAIGLARGGVTPLLIERDAETRDALCGGFLSWATLARLATLGVDPIALGAHRIERVALLAGNRQAEARLPAPAAALSRRTLDTALLRQAEAAGAGIERGIAVRAFDTGTLRLDDGGTIAGDSLVLATGKHELRGTARPKAGDNAAIGLRWRLGASPTLTRLLAGRIELHLFRGGYAGLNLQEDGGANLCLAVRPARFAAADHRPDTLLAQLAREAPALADRIAAAATVGPAQAIANVPYGWRATTGTPGLYRIGDQCGVIPSLAGEGMAIAIASGGAAAEAILRGEPAPLFQPRFARRIRRPITLAAALWHTAEHPAGARALIVAVAFAPALAGLAARLTRLD